MWSLYTRGIQKRTENSSFGKYLNDAALERNQQIRLQTTKHMLKPANISPERASKLKPCCLSWAVFTTLGRMMAVFLGKWTRRNSCRIPQGEKTWANADKTWSRLNRKYRLKFGDFYPHKPYLSLSYFPNNEFHCSEFATGLRCYRWISRHETLTNT